MFNRFSKTVWCIRFVSLEPGCKNGKIVKKNVGYYWLDCQFSYHDMCPLQLCCISWYWVSISQNLSGFYLPICKNFTIAFSQIHSWYAIVFHYTFHNLHSNPVGHGLGTSGTNAIIFPYMQLCVTTKLSADDMSLFLLWVTRLWMRSYWDITSGKESLWNEWCNFYEF